MMYRIPSKKGRPIIFRYGKKKKDYTKFPLRIPLSFVEVKLPVSRISMDCVRLSPNMRKRQMFAAAFMSTDSALLAPG